MIRFHPNKDIHGFYSILCFTVPFLPMSVQQQVHHSYEIKDNPFGCDRAQYAETYTDLVLFGSSGSIYVGKTKMDTREGTVDDVYGTHA